MSKEARSKASPSYAHNSCLDVVLAAEHIVHLSQVVSTRVESLGVAGRLEVLLEVSMLTEGTHLSGR